MFSIEKNYGIFKKSKINDRFIPKDSLEKNTLMHYKCTNYRDAKSEIGIIWNDKDLKIKWPVKKPILSVKDTLNISLKEYLKIK